MIGVPGGHDGAGDARHTVVRHVRHPDVAVLGPAAADRPEGQVQRVQQGVVPVEHRQALRLQIFKDLALGLQDTLPAAQVLDVGVADVGDDGDVRPHHLPQVADLPEVVHAGLDHRRLVLRPQAQQGQRGADIVVEVLRRLQHPELRPQHGGDHVLCGGLAHAAGDLDKGDGEPVPVGGRQGPQGQAGVRHPDVELAGPQRLRHPGAQAPGGTGVQRGVDEVVAVESLPHPGQKQAARSDLPAVGAHRGDGGRLLPGIQPGAVHGGYDLRDGHWLHAVHPLLFTSQESRTISSQSCS